LLDGIFHLTYVKNVGAAFGLLPGYQPIFIATSCVVLIVIGAYWRRARPKSWPIVIALGLIAGGAVGNLIDRAVLGRVTDIFDFTLIDFPVFNIADTAIVVGVGILIAWLLFAPAPARAGDASSDTEVAAEPETQPDANEAVNVQDPAGEPVPAAAPSGEVDWL
jgi:signal peptidase II